MRNIKLLAIAISAAATLSGCASNKQTIPLSPVVRKEIKSSDVYLETCQKELAADVERSNVATYGGGGLLLALVDCAVESYREGCANDAMAEMQKDFAACNLQQKVESQLAISLENSGWLQPGQIQKLEKIENEILVDKISKSQKDVFAVTKVIYKLNPDFSVLSGQLFLTVYPASKNLKALMQTDEPLSQPVFKVNVKAAEGLTSNAGSKEDNAKKWSAQNGQFLRDSLNKINTQMFSDLDRLLKNPEYIAAN